MRRQILDSIRRCIEEGGVRYTANAERQMRVRGLKTAHVEAALANANSCEEYQDVVWEDALVVAGRDFDGEERAVIVVVDGDDVLVIAPEVTKWSHHEGR